MIFYFSGTGNSEWIANQLSKGQNEDLVFIPEALKNEALEFDLQKDEKIGFVFPIYSWAPPEIVLRFINRISLKEYQNQYLFFVCSCGDDTGLTQQVLVKALNDKGWLCHAAGLSDTGIICCDGYDEELIDRCGLAAPRVMSLVTMLEMDGILRREKGRLILGTW